MGKSAEKAPLGADFVPHFIILVIGRTFCRQGPDEAVQWQRMRGGGIRKYEKRIPNLV